MPDQYGNPTPADVMAQIIQERELGMRAAQTPHQRRIAQMAAVGKTIFSGFDPRMVRAQEISDALEKSTKIDRMEGEDQLSFEIRQARLAFDEMKNVDPVTAAEISSKLTELEAERLERSFLTQRRELEMEAMEESVTRSRRENILDGIQYELDPRSGKLTGEFVNMADADAALSVDDVAGRGNILLPADDVRGLMDTSTADFNLWNNSDFSTQLEQIDTQVRNVGVANQLAEVMNAALAEGDNPAAFFDSLERKLGGVMEGIDDLKGLAGGERPVPGDPRWNRDISAAEDFIRREGIRSGVTASLLTTLAYTRARTFDNRVTDQDFRKAYDMLGADSGDPAVIMSNLRSIIFGDSQSLFDTVRTKMEAADPYLPEEGKGRAQIETVQAQLGLLQEYVDEFDTLSNQILETYGVGDASTGGNRPGSSLEVRSSTGRTFRARR